MSGLALLLGLVGFVVFAGLAESIVHRGRLAKIPIRIHVNGTRGKSSVTRLIAAGLRSGGIRTVAKTTGTLPRLILPDGNEVPIERQSRPNIIEQREVIRDAAHLEAEAVVVECMALQPWLQWISESKLVRATHGVVTNARADHLDVMGPDETHVALALANMTPRKGTLFTAERKLKDIFERAAEDRESRFLPVEPAEVNAVTDEEMSRFAYEEHRENVALALKICAELGVDRELALKGMWQATPDPGATLTHELDFWGRRIVFVNAFAANDPSSSERIWHQALSSHAEIGNRIALFNCRSDRTDRSRQLARAVVDWAAADHYVLTGTGTRAFQKHAVLAGIDPSTIHTAERESPTDLFEILVDLAGGSGLIVGMGNIGDNGLEIARIFRNRGTLARRIPETANSQRAVPDFATAEIRELELAGAVRANFEPSSNGKASSNGKH